MSGHPSLEIIPLGGLGEFGMNMMLYRLGRDCILVDTGMMFPGAEHHGVDVVIPDLSFLDECGKIHGIVLTHGHEDHIGALPFVLSRHDVPVHATPFTTGLIRRRLKRHDLAAGDRFGPLPEPGGRLRLGPFEIEAVPVAHSIPQAVMIVLRTAAGTVVHTADFKLDPDPPLGPGTDHERLAAIGREGVLALLSDSTNADRPGATPGERTVRPALERIIGSARGRVFLTTFASNVARIQQVIEIAAACRRKVALVGASIRAQVDVAEGLGLFRFPAGVRREPDSAMELRPEQAVFVVSGSQGEPMSAMARIALDRHRDVYVEEGDVFVHSARVIPGNEKSVGRMIDHLLRRGAEVVTARDADVHVSGHPSAGELEALLDLLQPRYLIPIHGEYRQLLAHARLGRARGMPAERVCLAESGDVVAVDEERCEIVDRIHVGQVFIDAALAEVDFETIRARRRLAGDGTVVVVVAVDRRDGTLTHPPELVTRGFVPESEEPELLAGAAVVLKEGLAASTAEERADEGALKARIHADLKRFFKKRTQRRPMIIPLILEH